MKLDNSLKARARARKALAGGVDSPVRAFGEVGGKPIFIKKATGCRITDLDGNSYVDFCNSWGALILGHAHPAVVKAVREAAGRGTSYGCPTEAETDLAEAVRKAVPTMERVRFVSSGTEAVMSAVRLARGFTSRDLVLKFDGCYHGHSDGLLVKAGSGVTGIVDASSKGVPRDVARNTLSVPYNDLPALERTMKRHGDRLACVLIEPVAANMGLVLPDRAWLARLRGLTQKHGALLIFDEVITGFRLSYGGAQEYFGIRPDLTCLGKIIGGGLPAAAFGGRRDIMALLAPDGPVYQAGTLSGNPLAMAAGLAALEELSKPGVYVRLAEGARVLGKSLGDIPGVSFVSAGSMFCLFFRDQAPRDYAEVRECGAAKFRRWFHTMLGNNFYLPPSQFETAFVSLAHSEQDLARFASAASGAARGAAA